MCLYLSVFYPLAQNAAPWRCCTPLRCRAGARGRGVCKQNHPQRDGELSESPYQQGWKCKMSWGQPESLPWAPAASTIPAGILGLVKAIKTKCDCSSSAWGVSASHGAGESALKWFQAALACCGLQKGGGCARAQLSPPAPLLPIRSPAAQGSQLLLLRQQSTCGVFCFVFFLNLRNLTPGATSCLCCSSACERVWVWRCQIASQGEWGNSPGGQQGANISRRRFTHGSAAFPRGNSLRRAKPRGEKHHTHLQHFSAPPA